jgi:KUP system potassium uptake protein
MDMPSSAPVGGLIDRSATGVVPGPPDAKLDQAKYLHHAGSPWFLALTALGVVFGDIGTSPLYAFQVALTGTGHPAPTAADVLGIVSLILWALMAMVSLKYVVFVLRADNDGEGGILALLSLVAADQVARGAKLPAIVLLGVVGASLLYGDGVITPAISVLSAMEGLKLAAPGFEHFYFKLGRLDDAISTYSASLQVNPKSAYSLYGRGTAKLKKGETAAGPGRHCGVKNNQGRS